MESDNCMKQAKTALRPRQLLKYAKHECGHALATLAFGGSFTDIAIGEEATTESDLSHLVSGQGIGGVIRKHGDGLTDPRFVVSLMAGVAGERVNRKKPGTLSFADILRGAESDYRAAHPICTPRHIRYFARKATTVSGYLNECLVSAFMVIQRYKQAHSALVEALMQRKRLTYAECIEIAARENMILPDKKACLRGAAGGI